MNGEQQPGSTTGEDMFRKTLPLLLAATIAPNAFTQQPAFKGIETADLDRSVQPCDNFYDFSNGAWRAQNPIPASMDRWSRRWQAAEINKGRISAILNEISAKADALPGSPAQIAGDFYGACTNIKAIDAAGVTPLKPYLAEIDAIHDLAGLQNEMRSLNAMGVMVPFVIGGAQDPQAPGEIIAWVLAGGLGLPDRDYYIRPEKRFADARADYLVYIAKLFALSGTPVDEANKAAQTVMRFETELAKATLDNLATRDPHAIIHPVSFSALQKMTPHFDWESFYESANLHSGSINVEQPEFLAQFDRQLASTPLGDWKIYLRWQLLNSSAENLSQNFVAAHFDFYQNQLAGISAPKPRITRCAETTDALFGEALGQEYVRRYFPPEAKQRAQVMVGNIVSVIRDTIENVDWMSPATKQRALEKLSSIRVKVGYPDKWKDYSHVRITRADYFADTIAASRFLVVDDFSTIGKPIDRSRWDVTPASSSAGYKFLLNEITLPAGILQPPAFSLNYTDAVNYGAIGVVIGHEISHAFDDQGAEFDGQGRLDNWWTSADFERFKVRTGCLAKQFDSFTIDGPGDIYINGKLTLGESIADLGGLKISYLAFKKTPQGRSIATIDGFTPDEQFFIAWGQFIGNEIRLEKQRLMVQGDPHPVSKCRVIGPVSNFPPFAKAFGCKLGSPMVRSEAERCVVW